MVSGTDQILRRQISEAFRQSSEQVDREVAESLTVSGKFERSFNSLDLGVVFANLIHTLVELQKFAGLTVPLVHNVAAIEVETRYPRISVGLVLHIHSPIKAFIDIEYGLINHPTKIGGLTLARRSLIVQEKTARFDLVAKAALSTINLEGLVERELKDPAQIIRQTLPHRLHVYGFEGQIGQVHLEITPDNHLKTLLSARLTGHATGD
ncbi:MAG: hypothetical protein WCF84_09645 [Anaerolineae bacterium]